MTTDVQPAVDLVTQRVRAALTVEERMRLVVDALWETLGTPAGGAVSWVGFYLPANDGRELLLGPSRNKPACSPIGLHGVCGQAYLTCRPRIVADVRTLGADYVACDPADLSELVYPLMDKENRCRAVLDFDSHALAAFDEADLPGVARVLRAAGLA